MKLFTICFLFTLISCSFKNKDKPSHLNVALTSKISTLDPAVCFDTICAEVVYQIYEPLYEYDYLVRPYRLKPLLAEDMPIIEDGGKKYTIKIKKNVQYHPHKAFGNADRTVTAHDIINQIKRLAHPKTESNGWWLFENKIVGLDNFRKKAKSDFSDFHSFEVSGLKAENDHTLVIKLNKPFPQLQFALAMAFTAPVPRELIQYYKNDLNHEAIGTGPFKLTKWDKGLSVKLAKFESYHPSTYPKKGDRYAYQHDLLKDQGKPIPFLEGVTFHIMKEAQTRWLNFLSKKIDFIILTKDHFSIALDPSGELKSEYKEQGIQVQVAPTLTYWWLSFNMNDPVVGKNIYLRQAIAHAVNIERYIKIFTNNIALKANSIYPPGVPGYDPASKLPYSYDLKKAKEFMVKAGYKDGKGLPIINYDVRGSNQVSRQMGEFIASELEKIGIKIQININTFPGFLNKARTGQLQFWQGGWAMDYPDPENTIQLFIKKNHPPGPNSSYFEDKKVEKLYEELSQLKPGSDTKDILEQVEKIVHEHLPWVMQFYARNYILFHKKVKNFRQSDIVYNNYKYLRLDAK